MNTASDDAIISILESTAPIERFCVYQPGDKNSVSILFYAAADRNLWVYVNRDDEFVDAAVDYLVRLGNRILRSPEEEKAYLSTILNA